jgi:DNA-binding transcriptional regulator LsrR (DeoR family)
MAVTHRARADQYARRINAAAELLATGLDAAEAARRLARRYRLSERQAWRYVEQARDQGTVEVPSPKVVFTVKLPTDLVRHCHFSRA